MKKTIVEKSGLVGDSVDSGTSIWRGEDENDSIAKASRDLNRNRAKGNLDKIIKNKIEDLSAEKSDDNIDSILEEIARERNNARELYLTETATGRSNKKQTRSNKEQTRSNKEDRRVKEADSRLDSLMDRLVSKLTRKPAAALKKLTGLIKEKEAALSLIMASYVDKVDDFIDKSFDESAKFIQAAKLYIKTKKAAISEALYKRRRPIIAGIIGLFFTSAAVSLAVENSMAYEYLYNGKVLGVVEDVDYVYDTIDAIGDKLACAYDAEINICSENDISFRKVAKKNRELDSVDDVLDRFTYMKDMTATAYAVVVDGQRTALLHSNEEAQGILDKIQGNFSKEKEGVEYESVSFAENVSIQEVDTKLGHIQKADEVLDYMLTGAVEVKTYAVKSGDTFGQIAKTLNISQSDLMATNPDINPARLSIGQELVLNRVRPVLTVQTTEIQEYIAPIDFDITYEESSSLFKGETTVKRAGVKGEKQVVARVVKNNGEEIDRVELKAEVISNPKDQIVVQGTKPLPPLIGTGVLQYPVRGKLSSPFGMRWGRMHNGIDLANSSGTKIRAADGGVVTSAGWEGALGYCVRIDHGQNRTTVYGHCSKLFVSKGDKVYQGQHIANVGSTGRSTGPHLHFEVHINGVPQNPLKYLK